ncbi:MAG: FUSC family protein [Ilumatobacteraceae bacterium]
MGSWVAANREAGRRAARCAVAIPLAFLVADKVIGGTQLPLYASFGGFALLVFADFPGDRRTRAVSYGALGVAGAVLISLGTVVAGPWPLSVATTLVVATAVLFAGVLSAAISAAGRALLLTFILPVTSPDGPSVIPERLGGWLLALVVCVPAALFLFPPVFHDRFREATARACGALADLLDVHLAGGSATTETSSADEATGRMGELQTTYRDATDRPIGLTAGSRALVRLVAELEWLTSLLVEPVPPGRGERRADVRDATVAAVAVLRASAAVLDPGRSTSRSADRGALDGSLAELTAARRRAFDAIVDDLFEPERGAASSAVPSFRPHEIASSVDLVGHSVSWSAMADGRPLRQRLTGRGLPALGPAGRAGGEVLPLRRTVVGYLDRRSVWLRNSIRGGLGLAVAVGVADLFDVQHSFWVVLGTLSVLRSSALTTGSTAVRAILGTVLGFAVGAGLILVLGTGQLALWIVLPVAVLVASFAPQAISFAAGQAAFTVVVVVLFNLIDPVGWKVGLVRIEDIAIGCAVSLVVGVLLWPRGAAAAVGAAMAAARRTGAVYFGRSVEVVTQGGAVGAAQLDDVLDAARVLDDAMRQFQVEVGGDRRRLDGLARAADGAARLRLAGDAVSSMGPGPASEEWVLPASRRVLAERLERVVDRASRPSAPSDDGDVIAPTIDAGAAREVVASIRREIRPGVELGDVPRRLVWASMYVHDLERRSS